MKNKQTKYELTIIVPVFGKSQNVREIYQQFTNYFSESEYHSKVLFVNNASSDRIQHLIEAICKVSEHFSFLQLQEKADLSTALKAGIDHVDTPFVGYIHADLQTSPFDFDFLLEHRHQYALVCGYRRNQKANLLKKMTKRLSSFFYKPAFADQACPLQIMETSFARQIPFFRGMHRFIPSVIQLLQGKIKQIPVRHYSDQRYRMTWSSLTNTMDQCIGFFVYQWFSNNYIQYKVQKQNL